MRDFESILRSLTDVDFVVHTSIIQIPLINEHRKLGYEVNVLGTHNVCKAVEELRSVKGMILASSWHTIGEREHTGTIDEAFGFRPDKVENRARLYVLSKIAQEAILRFHDEMSRKIYGILRMGTVLGDGMPKETAANIFIEEGLKGDPITPYKHTMHRPMLYVDIRDVCDAFESFVSRALNGKIVKASGSLSNVVNVYYPEPTTILELANLVSDTIRQQTDGKIKPKVEIVEKGIPFLFSEADKKQMKVDVSKAYKILGISRFRNPKESIEDIVRIRLEVCR